MWHRPLLGRLKKPLILLNSKQPLKPDRAWRIVAGPELTPNQLHCATVPDGPNCRWEGGEYERIEKRNKAMLRAHFSDKAAECLIQPHHPPVNVVGGYKFPGAPVVDLTAPVKSAPMSPAQCGIPDDLSIPQFLRRSLPLERDSNFYRLAA